MNKLLANPPNGEYLWKTAIVCVYGLNCQFSRKVAIIFNISKISGERLANTENV